MTDRKELLSRIRSRTPARTDRTRLHAVRHMVEEGFSEGDIIEALLGKSRIVENYPDENRCLVIGYFRLNDKVQCPLLIFLIIQMQMCLTLSRATFPKNHGGP